MLKFGQRSQQEGRGAYARVQLLWAARGAGSKKWCNAPRALPAQGRERVAGVAEADAPASDADLASSSSGGEGAGEPESEVDSEEEQQR